MRIVVTISLLVAVQLAGGSDPLKWRNELIKAHDSKAITLSMCQELACYKDLSDPLMAGYLAMARFMLSKHVLNPFNKVQYFNEGKELLERAISKDASAELRYLRLSVQMSAPAFLGYKGQLTEDFLFLKAWLATYSCNGDWDLQHRVKELLNHRTIRS